MITFGLFCKYTGKKYLYVCVQYLNFFSYFRLLEVNGKILGASRNLSQSSTLDELSRLLAVSYDPAEIVVLRPRRSHSQNLDSNYSTTLTSSSNSANRRLKADNLRLTHRICYLEEQVRRKKLYNYFYS